MKLLLNTRHEWHMKHQTNKVLIYPFSLNCKAFKLKPTTAKSREFLYLVARMTKATMLASINHILCEAANRPQKATTMKKIPEMKFEAEK